MEPNKYDLENLLLYLENKLSDKDSQIISNELLNNEDKLNSIKELSFRGQEQSYCYKYSFFDLIITIVQNQTNLWEIYINNPNSKNSYTIINNKEESMSRKKNGDIQHVQITISGNYYILLKDQSETKILEISI